jgi:flagellar biosynthetic protein FlhB
VGDEDKQFDASPDKIRKAREEGNVFKSQDLNAAIGLVAVFYVLMALMPIYWHELATLFVLIFEQVPHASISNMGWQYLALITLKATVILGLPLIIISALVGIITNVAQVGPLLATKAIGPKFDKLNPVNGFKSIFSQRTVVELIKNLIKISILSYLAYTVVSDMIMDILNSGQTDNIFTVLFLFKKLLDKLLLLVGIGFLAIAGFDFLYQRQKYMKDQKMSMKEVKDEYKQSEGDPHVKAALRQKRMEMMQQRMLEAVPTADVVTTNPIHVAVALKYDQGTNPEANQGAPIVVAKGAERFAQQIKAIAIANNVPVIENPPLARTLYQLVEIDQEIPANLYQAVASLLMIAWRIKGQSPALIPTP